MHLCTSVGSSVAVELGGTEVAMSVRTVESPAVEEPSAFSGECVGARRPSIGRDADVDTMSERPRKPVARGADRGACPPSTSASSSTSAGCPELKSWFAVSASA